jgi:hypothetical protein
MKKIFRNILVIFSLLIILTVIFLLNNSLKNNGGEIGKNNVNEIGNSTYSGFIKEGQLMLLNNVWGITEEEKNNKSVESYIYLKDNGNFGWEWSRPKDQNLSVPPIYPEVVIGSTPGSTDSTTKLFPIRYKDIDNWTSEVEFQYIKNPTGQHNFAYDIYLVDGNGDIKYNFMIWIYGHIDDAQYIKDISDGINKYGFYRRKPDSNGSVYWHAFILNDQGSTKFKVDIKKLLDQVPSRINGNWYVKGIELGNEIYSGSGRIEINKYVTNLNGEVIDSSSYKNL